MKAFVLDRQGPLDDLRIAGMETPESGPGEVRVQVHAAGLNSVD